MMMANSNKVWVIEDASNIPVTAGGLSCQHPFFVVEDAFFCAINAWYAIKATTVSSDYVKRELVFCSRGSIMTAPLCTEVEIKEKEVIEELASGKNRNLDESSPDNNVSTDGYVKGKVDGQEPIFRFSKRFRDRHRNQ